LTLNVYPEDPNGGLTVSPTMATVQPGDHVSVTTTLSSGSPNIGQNVTLDLRDGSGYISKRRLTVFPSIVTPPKNDVRGKTVTP
jgi:hypothetical protein